MPRLAGLLLAAATVLTVMPAAAAVGRGSCEWKSPGHDPYMGDVPSAVDSYTDIPADTRARLKARMERWAYDDIVAIRRDAIEGNFRYEPALLDMHFGSRRLCGEVTRKTWRPDHEERGLAYCEDGHCVVVPLVCRNVSRIKRQPVTRTLSATPAEDGPLIFDPPSAGLQPGTTTPEDPVARLLASPRPPGPVVVTPAPPLPGLIPQPSPWPAWPQPGIPPLPPPAPAVPEPATWLLWLVGLVAGGVWRSQARMHQRGSAPHVD